MEKYLDLIINGTFALLGVALGFFLQLFSTYLSERRRIKQEFSQIKASIYSTTIMNNLFPELLKLKRFFVSYNKLLKRKENKYFYQKWLTEPNVETAFTGVGYWNNQNVKEMLNDLDKTKL